MLEEGLQARDAAKKKPAAAAAAAAAKPKAAATAPAPAAAAAAASIPVAAPAGQAQPRQEGISTYNGTDDQGYSWAQTAADVTVQVLFERPLSFCCSPTLLQPPLLRTHCQNPAVILLLRLGVLPAGDDGQDGQRRDQQEKAEGQCQGR